MRKALSTLAFAASLCAAAQAHPAYVAASFDTNSIVFLDDHMQRLSSFTVADPLPNGVTATHNLIYAGYFIDSSVVAYGYDGLEHFRWSAPDLDKLTGLAAFGPYLAVSSDTTVYLLQAKTGGYVAQLSAHDSIEGLAYDGAYLWTLGSDLVARNPDTGFVERTIPNAALGCDFAGTGIASAGAGRLMLGCSDGRWFEVSERDGSVLASGNNGVDMFDLAAVPAPEPATLALLLAGLGLVGGLARKRAG
jgi:hypothetical protein